MRQELRHYLADLEKQSNTDLNIEAYRIRKILSPEESISEQDELAELYAFTFVYKESEDKEKFYGRRYVLDGRALIFPDRKNVDNDIVNYWLTRASESKNIILQSRYLELYLDFSKPGKSHTQAIRKYLELANSRKANIEILVKSFLFAHQLNDDKTIKEIINRLTVYAEKNPAYSACILRVLSNSKYADKAHQETVAKILYKRLESTNSLDIYSTFDDEVITLCKHFEKDNKGDKIENVLEQSETIYRNNNRVMESAFIKTNFLQKYFDIYGLFTRYNFAKEKQAKLSSEIVDLTEQMNKQMKTLSYTHNLTEKDKKYCKNVVRKTFYESNRQKRNLKDICQILYQNLTPNLETTKEQLENVESNSILLNLVDQEIIGQDNITIGILTPKNQDAKLARFYKETLRATDFLCFHLFNKFKDNYTQKEFIELLKSTPLYRESDSEYYNKLFTYFWENDYYAFSALALPLIEDLFRVINVKNGFPILKSKKNDYGGYELVSLGSLCDNKMTKAIFGDDFVYYCKNVLTDTMGWNIRNNFAHGINKHMIGDYGIACRLMLIFCTFTLAQKIN